MLPHTGSEVELHLEGNDLQLYNMKGQKKWKKRLNNAFIEVFFLSQDITVPLQLAVETVHVKILEREEGIHCSVLLFSSHQ